MNRLFRVSAVAGLLALAGVGAASASPPPPPPQFQFGIQLGNNGGYDPGPSDCASDYEITLDLRGQGYRHVRLVDDTGDSLIFDATRKSRLYELEVDSCSGDILSRTRIYHY